MLHGFLSHALPIIKFCLNLNVQREVGRIVPLNMCKHRYIYLHLSCLSVSLWYSNPPESSSSPKSIPTEPKSTKSWKKERITRRYQPFFGLLIVFDCAISRSDLVHNLNLILRANCVTGAPYRALGLVFVCHSYGRFCRDVVEYIAGSSTFRHRSVVIPPDYIEQFTGVDLLNPVFPLLSSTVGGI